jgi:hypothetical protein
MADWQLQVNFSRANKRINFSDAWLSKPVMRGTGFIKIHKTIQKLIEPASKLVETGLSLNDFRNQISTIVTK